MQNQNLYESNFQGKKHYSDSNFWFTSWIDFARQKGALHTENLDALRQFKVAIDAELLLSKVTKSNALKSI